MNRLLRRIGGNVQALLRSSTPPDRPPVEAPAQPNGDPLELANSIRRAIGQADGTRGEAFIHYIGLSRLRDRLGGDLEKTAKRVDGVACQEIERRLEPTDVFKSMANLNYLILFTHMTRQQAQLKCALIAEDIAKRLLGSEFDASLLLVKVAVARADGSVVLEDVPRIGDMAEALFLAHATATLVPEKAGAAGIENEEEAEESSVSKVRLVYRPMWDVRQNTLATYICIPAIDGADGTLTTGDAAVPDIAKSRVAFELDEIVLHRVIQDLRALEAARRKLLLIIPVHFETIASRRRREAYIRWCHLIPVRSRKLVIFELVAVPEQIPPGRLFELAIQFRNYSRAVILRTPITRYQFHPPAETGIFAVGADLSSSDKGEAELMAHMERFASLAAKIGLRSYVHGLGSVSLTTAAVGAGFEYIDSDVITTVNDSPREAYRFEARNIYSNPFEREERPTTVA